MTWDPTQYQRYSDERSRPFHELVDRIVVDPVAVGTAVDLGCGPGHLTASLCDRWPNTQVIGVDIDANMLASAAALAGNRLSFKSGTVQGLATRCARRCRRFQRHAAVGTGSSVDVA